LNEIILKDFDNNLGKATIEEAILFTYSSIFFLFKKVVYVHREVFSSWG